MIRIEDLYKLFLQHPVVCTDTRKISPGCIFFCLKGENHDGNRFAQSAIEGGAAFAVIDDIEHVTVPRTILVDDSLLALQALAAHHRKQFRIPVLGITGTNGKTTTKELINAVLSKKYRVTATAGNFNNHIGVPLTLLQINQDTQMAVIEMGANHPGEIAELCAMVQPGLGIITNTGKAHLEGFGSLENIVETKTALYRSVAENGGKVFIYAGHRHLIEKAGSLPYILYGEDPQSDCPGKITRTAPFVEFIWGKGLKNKTQSRLAGSWNFENMLAAACIGTSLKVPAKKISEAIRDYTPTNMRSQVKVSDHNTILIDAYNANPSSMQAAISHFAATAEEKRSLIIGDMLELGTEAAAEHRRIVDLIISLKFDEVYLIGKNFFSLKESGSFQAFQDTDHFLEYLTKHPIRKRNILLKGSRGIRLERLLEHL